jgi:fucose 4-O-acetylase-like acetyltransferase
MDQIQTPPRTNVARIGEVDTIKGIAIILMVYGHVQQGAMHRHLWDTSPALVNRLRTFDNLIYSFHMATFFFVAGLFLLGSVKHRGRRGFVVEKAKTVLYPYILWAILYGLSDPLTAPFRAAAKPFSLHSLFAGMLTGNDSWFLITLFICQLLAVALVRLPHWLQMSIALVASVVVPDTGITVLYAPFQYLPFVVAGSWYSGDRLPLLERIPKVWSWFGFAFLLILQWTLIYRFGPVTRWDRAPLGLLGIAMLLFFAQAIRFSVPDRVLHSYGEGSLAIFLLSPLVQGLGREFVMHVLHTTRPLPYLGFTTLLAATLPLLVWKARFRLHIAWLFRWPATQKRVAPSPTRPVAG